MVRDHGDPDDRLARSAAQRAGRSPVRRAMTSPRPRDQADPSLGPVLDFLRLIWELDHALQLRSKRMAKELGVTGPQRLVLRIVGRFPSITAGDLASLLSLHPSTLTGMLQRLERAGYLRRTSHPEDRRRVQLSLSERGAALDGSVAHTVEGALEVVHRELSEAEMAAAAKLLRALKRELDQMS